MKKIRIITITCCIILGLGSVIILLNNDDQNSYGELQKAKY